MESYIPLSQKLYQGKLLTLKPIRLTDRYDIMKWRNDQIYHLRQKALLTKEEQDSYFNNIISKQFQENQPNQILFSALKEGQLIGYGGLVHIDWESKNAEISFLMKTELQEEYFCEYWTEFLSILKVIAFKDLDMTKIYTYAYDIRPLLPFIFEHVGFQFEGKLKKHHIYNNQIMDVMIHSFVNPFIDLRLRKVSIKDITQLYNWANEDVSRKNSINQEKISFATHYTWFAKQITDPNTEIFILNDSIDINLGQIRFVRNSIGKWIVNYSIDKNYRKLGLGREILIMGMNQLSSEAEFEAVVEDKNLASQKIFNKAGFKHVNSFNKNGRNFLVFHK